jgi:hypothetical protein
MTTSDTSAIDEKKDTDTEKKSLTSIIVNFILTFFIFVLLILSQFSLGGVILYWSKLAESNILPTEDTCFPYTDNEPNIQPIKSNIFSIDYDGELQSVKINFPYDKMNSKNSIIDILRRMKGWMPPPSNIVFYFVSILENMFAFNYGAFNTFLNFFNNAPETVTIILGPILTALYASIVFICSVIYFIYLWFSQMSWFFKQNTAEKTEMPKWGDVSFTDPVNYMTAFGKVLLFSIIFMFIFMSALPVVPLFCLAWTILSMLGYKSVIANKNTNVFTIIKGVLKNYKISITTIISIFLIISIFGNFGPIAGGITAFILILVYSGKIATDMFKPFAPENLSPYINVEQAKKTCKMAEPKKHGFLYNLIFGQKGGSSQLLKDLKKMNKKLNTNL